MAIKKTDRGSGCMGQMGRATRLAMLAVVGQRRLFLAIVPALTLAPRPDHLQ
jgi:hypothetical protein